MWYMIHVYIIYGTSYMRYMINDTYFYDRLAGMKAEQTDIIMSIVNLVT